MLKSGVDVTTSWCGVPSGTLWMIFTFCPNLMFLAFPWPEIYRFSNWSFCWLWAVQNWHFPNFGQAKMDTTSLFLLTLGRSVYLLTLGKILDCKKQSKPSLTKNSRTRHRIWHKSFWMIQSGGIKNWVTQLINRLQTFNLFFL